MCFPTTDCMTKTRSLGSIPWFERRVLKLPKCFFKVILDDDSWYYWYNPEVKQQSNLMEYSKFTFPQKSSSDQTLRQWFFQCEKSRPFSFFHRVGHLSKLFTWKSWKYCTAVCDGKYLIWDNQRTGFFTKKWYVHCVPINHCKPIVSSPDLAPCDFLFSRIKKHMEGKRFADVAKVKKKRQRRCQTSQNKNLKIVLNSGIKYWTNALIQFDSTL